MNVQTDIRLEVGEHFDKDQVRLELKRVRTISGVPFATFDYYYDGVLQQEIVGSATPDDGLHELPGTTYGIMITGVTAGTC